MSRMHRLTALVALTAIGLSPWPARLSAQSCGNVGGNPTCTVAISLPVNAVTYLLVSPSSTTLGAPTFAGAGTADTVYTTGPTVTVKSNAPFMVAVCAAAHPCTWTVTGGGSKAAGDLHWGTVLGTYPNSAAGVANLFNTGTAPTSTSSLPIFYRTIWDITSSPPATYTMVVNFTISAP